MITLPPPPVLMQAQIELQMPMTPDAFNQGVKTTITPEIQKYCAALAGILGIRMLILR